MNADKRYYLDTSALLPYYREESASHGVQEILLSLKPPIFISDLTRVEFASAIARWVRMAELSEEQACLIEKTFSKDIDSGLYSQRPIIKSHYHQAEKCYPDEKPLSELLMLFIWLVVGVWKQK